MSVFVKDMVSPELFRDLITIADMDCFRNVWNQRFLVTGGNGFIAYHMVLTLMLLNDEKQRGNTVTILVRSREGAERRYGALMEREDLKIMVQDVCEMIPEETESFDYIIHAAGAADAKHFEDDPIGVFNTNVIGTERLIDFMRRRSCKSMVYVSSFTIYGKGTEMLPEVTEDYRGGDDWNTNAAFYAMGKRSAEFLCMAAFRKYGCPIRIIRPGFVYGASSPSDHRVYSEIIQNAAARQPIELRSPGLLFRSMVYVTDVVRGTFQVLLCGQDGEAYNVANEFISIRDFAEAAARAEDGPELPLRYVNPNDAAVVPDKIPGGAISIQKLRNCGCTPMVSLRTGIYYAIQSFRHSYPEACGGR